MIIILRYFFKCERYFHKILGFKIFFQCNNIADIEHFWKASVDPFLPMPADVIKELFLIVTHLFTIFSMGFKNKNWAGIQFVNQLTWKFNLLFYLHDFVFFSLVRDEPTPVCLLYATFDYEKAPHKSICKKCIQIYFLKIIQF